MTLGPGNSGGPPLGRGAASLPPPCPLQLSGGLMVFSGSWWGLWAWVKSQRLLGHRWLRGHSSGAHVLLRGPLPALLSAHGGDMFLLRIPHVSWCCPGPRQPARLPEVLPPDEEGKRGCRHWLSLPGLFPQPPGAYGGEDACMGCPHGREVAPLAACPHAVHTVVSLRCSSHRHVRDAGGRRLREMTRRGRKGRYLHCVQACTRRAASPQGREGGGGPFLGPSCGGIRGR